MSIDYAAYPYIPLEQLRMLWIHDYYDGPLSGMLLFKGRMCWYELCARGGEERDRPNVWRYVICADFGPWRTPKTERGERRKRNIPNTENGQAEHRKR